MRDRHNVLTELEIVPAPSWELKERILLVRQRLFGELAVAHAPVTGKHIACGLETINGGLFLGTNCETLAPHLPGEKYSIHAEVNALTQKHNAGDRSHVGRIYMAGFGQQQRDSVFPCGDCHVALSLQVLPTTELVVFSPNDFNTAYAMRFGRSDGILRE